MHHLRLASPLVLLVTALVTPLVTPLWAQTQSLAAETPVGVFLVTQSEQRHAAVPATTPVLEERAVSVVSVFGPFASASASACAFGARITLLEAGTAFTRGATAGANVGTAQGSAQSASHDWRWTLSGPRTGELAGSCHGRLDGTVSAFRVEVDVDADGAPEFTMTTPGLVPFRIPLQRAAGFAVRVRAFGSVGLATVLGEGYSISLTLAWVESGGATPVSFGPTDNVTIVPCGAPDLWATDVPAGMDHVLEFPLTRAFAGAPAALLFGVQPALIALPGSPCHLEVLPLIAVPATADGQGAYRWRLRVPGPFPVGQWFAQAVTLDASVPAIRASRGWRLVFAD